MTTKLGQKETKRTQQKSRTRSKTTANIASAQELSPTSNLATIFGLVTAKSQQNTDQECHDAQAVESQMHSPADGPNTGLKRSCSHMMPRVDINGTVISTAIQPTSSELQHSRILSFKPPSPPLSPPPVVHLQACTTPQMNPVEASGRVPGSSPRARGGRAAKARGREPRPSSTSSPCSVSGWAAPGRHNAISPVSSPRARGTQKADLFDGSRWMKELVNQQHSFTEINRSITKMWCAWHTCSMYRNLKTAYGVRRQSAAREGLVELPRDTRLQSKQGRVLYEEARKKWLADEKSGTHGVTESEKQEHQTKVVDTFVEMFGH